MGIIILRKRYDIWKYTSVIMITFGIILCTIASGSKVEKIKATEAAAAEIEAKTEAMGFSVFFWWALGITLLTVALFLSARMGIYQEVLYKRYGKYPNEALFYTHLLPLPGFLLLYTNIKDHIMIASASSPYEVPIVGISVPLLWLYLLGNVLTQYLCISSVYVLTTECSSLTVTLVVTLRKFVSLLFSIIYFRNPFTLYHWSGTLLVFVGTIIFTEIVPSIQKSMAQRQRIEKSKKAE